MKNGLPAGFGGLPRKPTMRKLIVCNIVSLDGFYSDLGRDVMAMPFDKGFSDYNAEPPSRRSWFRMA